MMRRRFYLASPVLVIFFAVAGGCGKIHDEKVIARVDGAEITMKEFRMLKAEHEGFPDDELFRQLLLKKALLKRAGDLGWFVSSEEVAQIIERRGIKISLNDLPGSRKKVEEQLLLERVVDKEIVPSIRISEEEIDGYRRDHSVSRKKGVRIALKQILVHEALQAEEIRGWVAADPIKFEKLARRHSIAPEREHGGWVGTFDVEEAPSVFMPMAATLPVGSVSPVFRTPYGYHVIIVAERSQTAGAVEISRTYIVETLRQQARERAIREWFKSTVKCSVDPKFVKLIQWQSNKL